MKGRSSARARCKRCSAIPASFKSISERIAKPMLRIEHLQVSYGETQILRDVDLEVGHGQVVCLMGRNGVGKTTLLKSIMGLLRPRAGRVLFEDRDLTRAAPYRRARAGIGYVPQGREIVPQLTVEENLKVGMLANPARPRTIPAQV